MNIINDYFNFKKSYLKEYAEILLEDMSDFESEILDVLLNVYINSYYFNEYETITTNEEYINLKDVREELKGKYLELVYELEEDKKLEYEPIIKRIYKIVNLICVIDLKKYEDANLINDYSLILEDIFFKNGKGIDYDTKMIEKIARLVKSNRIKTIKYIDNSKSDVFYIKTIIYRGFSDRYIAKMLYTIPTVENYKDNVVDNIYNNENIFLPKLKTKIELLNAIILEKIIKRDRCGLYFIQIPVEYVKKEDIKELLSLINNPLSEKHIVFLLDYQLYKTKSHLFNSEDKVKYAALANFKRVKDVNMRLTELETNPIFKYVIVDGVSTEDRKQILNYEMPGKEIFENIYDFNSSEE